jgi:uncharacterized membrane protein YecN with MAPEG domain
MTKPPFSQGAAARLQGKPLGRSAGGASAYKSTEDQNPNPEGPNPMHITALYAALLTLLYLYLSVRVIGRRRAIRVALGDGGDRSLLRRQRVHANFAEYVPLALILMALAEAQGLPHWMLQALGLGLLAGRLVHAYGVSGEPERLAARSAGMGLTFTVLALGAAANLVMAAAA